LKKELEEATWRRNWEREREEGTCGRNLKKELD
jgi:hypothetical protein